MTTNLGKGSGAEIVAQLSPEQQSQALAALLSGLEPGHIAEALAGLVPAEQVAPLLLPYLLDAQTVRAKMNERSRQLGKPRNYDKMAVPRRTARGTLPSAGTLNGGNVYWVWDVERMLRELNPAVGRRSSVQGED